MQSLFSYQCSFGKLNDPPKMVYCSTEFAMSILKNVRLIQFAESLGGVETLITYPITQTHADVPKELLEKNGITESVLRLSVGIESGKDLIFEFERVFGKAREELDGREES